jgi:L-lactate dehydrogenase complex protein LldG
MPIDETTTKEKILTGIRNALMSKKENPFKNVNFDKKIFHDLEDEKEVVFASKLLDNSGKFVYCENEASAMDILQALIKEKGWDAVYTPDEELIRLLSDHQVPVKSEEGDFLDQKAGITRCEYLIARFGSVMVSSALNAGRRMFIYPETHIIIAKASQVVTEIKDALTGIKNKYKNQLPSQITVITGPSRTADIEKTLVMGAHGPKELYVFLIDDI